MTVSQYGTRLKGVEVVLQSGAGTVPGLVPALRITDPTIVDNITAQGEGNAIAVTLTDSTTPVPHTTTRLDWPKTTDGAWSWYSRPEARTVGTITYWFPVNQLGEVLACAYNASTRVYTEVVLETLTGGTGNGRDDHNNGASIVLADGKLLVFYSDHNGTVCKCRKQTTAGNPSAWDAAVSVTTSTSAYVLPVQLSGTAGTNGGDIYCFMRYNSVAQPRAYAKSTDGGATWSALVNLFTAANNADRTSTLVRPYMHVVATATKIHFSLSDGNPPEIRDPDTNAFVCSIWHGYFDSATGNVHKSDGTVVAGGTFAAPPAGGFDVSSLTQVLDGYSRQLPYWNWDIQLDGSDRPVIAAIKYNGSTSTPYTASDYTVSRWTGLAWTTTVIDTLALFGAVGTPIGYLGTEPFYHGGIALDPDDPTGTAYVSNHDTVGSAAAWSIWKITSSDGGNTWAVAQKMNTTRGGERRCIRPIVPVNASADLQLLWMEGHYQDYQGAFPANGVGGFDHNMYATGIQSYPRLNDGYAIWIKPGASTVHLHWDDESQEDTDDFAGVWAGWAHASRDIHVNRWKNDPIDLSGNTQYTTIHMMRWARPSFTSNEQHVYSSNWKDPAAAILSRETGNSAGDFAQMYRTTSGSFGSGAVSSSPAVQTWFVYAVGWNSATNNQTRPYKDGVALTAITGSAAALHGTPSDAPFWYGASPHTAAAHNYWRGEIGFVGVCETELSANFIAEMSASNPFDPAWSYGTFGEIMDFSPEPAGTGATGTIRIILDMLGIS